jgi:hypothetical protein
LHSSSSFLNVIAGVIMIILWLWEESKEISINYSSDTLQHMNGQSLESYCYVQYINILYICGNNTCWDKLLQDRNFPTCSWIQPIQLPLLPSIQWKFVTNHNSLGALFETVKKEERTLIQTMTRSKGNGKMRAVSKDWSMYWLRR